LNPARTGPGGSPLGWVTGLAALGALQTLAFVQPWGWPLSLLATALLAAACGRASPGRAALLGWAYGFGWLAAGTWWLFISMHRYGGLPAPLAAAAVALLAGALSLYLGAAMAAYARWRSGQVAADAGLFAGLWLLAELARGVLFTGFPWVASGYAHLDGPLAGLLPWAGVYGVGALSAALAVGMSAGWRARGVVVLVLGAMAALPVAQFTQPAGSLRLALLQPQVPQDEKFAADRMPETLAWVADAMTKADADLVIAPETAVPLLPDQLVDLAPGYWPALAAHFQAPGRAALVGVPLGNFDEGYTNSVVGLSAGPAYRYDKHHLVPFGEFIPTGFRWFTRLMNIPLGDFNRGLAVAPSFPVGTQRVAPNICYEDLFGEELALRFADPATAPTVLANLSNIGWFGPTVAVPQHLAISRTRSLELQRPMVRATNTGATAVVDHRGQVTAQWPPGERGVLLATVQGREGLTPFAWWAARAGLWPLVVAAWLAMGPALWLTRTRRPARGRPAP
jgi:apolipoprotein N-acyltransferase